MRRSRSPQSYEREYGQVTSPEEAPQEPINRRVDHNVEIEEVSENYVILNEASENIDNNETEPEITEQDEISETFASEQAEIFCKIQSVYYIIYIFFRVL